MKIIVTVCSLILFVSGLGAQDVPAPSIEDTPDAAPVPLDLAPAADAPQAPAVDAPQAPAIDVAPTIEPTTAPQPLGQIEPIPLTTPDEFPSTSTPSIAPATNPVAAPIASIPAQQTAPSDCVQQASYQTGQQPLRRVVLPQRFLRVRQLRLFGRR